MLLLSPPLLLFFSPLSLLSGQVCNTEPSSNSSQIFIQSGADGRRETGEERRGVREGGEEREKKTRGRVGLRGKEEGGREGCEKKRESNGMLAVLGTKTV